MFLTRLWVLGHELTCFWGAKLLLKTPEYGSFRGLRPFCPRPWFCRGSIASQVAAVYFSPLGIQHLWAPYVNQKLGCLVSTVLLSLQRAKEAGQWDPAPNERTPAALTSRNPRASAILFALKLPHVTGPPK